MSRFRTVAFDVDSTLSGLEGIDWLAARRGPEVAAQIAALTDQAMSGAVPIESLYGKRLDLVRPGADEVAALAVAYRETAAPGARETLATLREAGVELRLVSGGLREAILPFAEWLGVSATHVHAVGIAFHPDGRYLGWEEGSSLATAAGKGAVLARLRPATPLLMVGDGATDLSARHAGALIAAYTGFVRREVVVSAADHVVASFAELRTLVLS